jgi:hypothetical protein
MKKFFRPIGRHAMAAVRGIPEIPTSRYTIAVARGTPNAARKFRGFIRDKDKKSGIRDAFPERPHHIHDHHFDHTRYCRPSRVVNVFLHCFRWVNMFILAAGFFAIVGMMARFDHQVSSDVKSTDTRAEIQRAGTRSLIVVGTSDRSKCMAVSMIRS